VPELTFQGETFDLEDSYATIMVADFSADLLDDKINLVALRALLQHLILPEDWERFHALCVDKRLGNHDLLKAVEEAIEAINERPTEQPTDSSDGLTTTPAKSEVASSLRVIGRLEGQGRPDLALQVKRAAEFRESLTA
jgi:hypothetical protein